MRTLGPFIAVVAVAATATGLLAPVSTTDAVAAAVVAASLALAAAERPQWVRAFLFAALAALAAGHGACARDQAFRAPVVAWHAARADRVGEPVDVRGVLVEDAAAGEFGVRLRLRLEAVRQDGVWHPMRGRLQLTVAGSRAAAAMSAWTQGRAIIAPVLLRQPSVHLNPGGPSLWWQTLRRPSDLVGTIKSAALVDVTPAWWWPEAAAAVRRHVRRAAAVAVAPWSPQSAALVVAVVIGDRASIDEEIADRLRAAGTYHVIAISGGNVALVVVLCVALSRLVVRGARAASGLALAAVLIYGGIVGPQPSVTRAVTGAAVYLAIGMCGLQPRAWPVLALVALAMTIVEPLQVIDVGAWLSFGATAGIILLTPGWLAGAGTAPRGGGPRFARAAGALFYASLAAELVLLPIQVGVFGRAGLVGLAANFIAIPAMAVVQIAGIIGLGLEPMSAPGARAAGFVAHVAATALTESARIADVAPLLVRRVPPAAMAWTMLYYAAGVVVWRAPRRTMARRIGAAAFAVAAVAVVTAPDLAMARPAAGRLRLTVIDVGQGDALLVQVPTGQSMLIDAGGADRDIGARVVVPAAWASGVRRLDWLVITHADLDHIGGARAVVEGLQPREIWEGVPVMNDARRRALVDATRSAGVVWRRLIRGDHLAIGPVEIDVLNPPEPDWDRPRVRNEDSVVLRLRHGAVELLLLGDAGAEFEARPIVSAASTLLRVIKVGHHGSRTSTTDPFLSAYRPDLAFVSVGRSNLFGHPAPDVIQRLRGVRADILRTDQDGAIVLESDGRSVEVVTAAGRRMTVTAWPAAMRASTAPSR